MLKAYNAVRNHGPPLLCAYYTAIFIHICAIVDGWCMMHLAVRYWAEC